MSSTDSEKNIGDLEGDSSDGVRIATPYDSDPALMIEDSVLDDRAFDRELRKRNLPMLLWTAVVFNTAYVAWAFFGGIKESRAPALICALYDLLELGGRTIFSTFEIQRRDAVAQGRSR